MQIRTLGNDLKVSAIGLGCMGMSHAYGKPADKKEMTELLSLLHRIAEEKQATPAQISLAWMLCKKPYIVPIPGTRKRLRLIENGKAAEIVLRPQEVEALDKALDDMEMSEVFGGSKVETNGGSQK